PVVPVSRVIAERDRVSVGRPDPALRAREQESGPAELPRIPAHAGVLGEPEDVATRALEEHLRREREATFRPGRGGLDLPDRAIRLDNVCETQLRALRRAAHRTLPARKPRPSGRGGTPISVVECPRLELNRRSASGPGDNQAVGPLRQPSKRRWCWTGRLPPSQAGRRTVNLEPQGQALGLKHGLLSLKAPDFSPGDVYRETAAVTTATVAASAAATATTRRLTPMSTSVGGRPSPSR